MAAPDKRIPLVLILAGTTASGKTEVSIPLALSMNAEIISADSRQVYRELKIGSAPPREEQLAAVPHHFVATKSLTERWTAGDFARAAREIIKNRSDKSLSTVVVGGSMLYLRALIDGLYSSENEPTIDYVALRSEWERRGSDEMMQELEQLDPEIAARTNRADSHRALRAIGHFRATGKRLSEMRRNEREPLPQAFKLYFLHGDRVETYDRVNRRAEDMLKQGLVDEVKQLLSLGFDETNSNALRTHGYQEVFPYLRGEYDYETMREEIQKAVRHYVKRQLTWFRRDTRAIWVSRVFTENPIDIAERICREFKG
ncbi:MAG: tRNA (adenosine(37)-N6)-dimethylallyltransferase MiaA [bacterium]|nr:tRNA (adenosine(37)-N6)-dimethylallyltransferase MiaA [bacterium]